MNSLLSDLNARYASVVAATAIALACGTNYAYSAWGPDFAERLELSSTEGNLIGAAGNVGAYAMGVPAGLLIDSRGPRVGVLVGAIAIACGYFPIHTAFDKGPGSMSVGFISFCSFLTGAGSCCAFSSALKTSAFNWPSHRGTATAFPLSGFGLSAFFFTTIGNMLFDTTGGFLLMLAGGTIILNGCALLFIRLIPTSQAIIPAPVPTEDPDFKDDRRNSETLRLRSSSDGGMADNERPTLTRRSTDLSDLERESLPRMGQNLSLQEEVTGVKLLLRSDFWQLFLMFSLLSGVGLMTINNIGNDAAALWRKYDENASHEFIHGVEQLHVGILSLCSFAGRLISGIGSDFLIKRLNASRFWCLVFSGGLFTASQALALLTTNPNYLFLVTSLTGLGYGVLFGCFPALTADAFGVQGLSLNWGFMIFAPTISGNVFNLMYGRIFDGNTPHDQGGKGECMEGLGCYATAYWLTLASSIAGVFGAIWCIGYENSKRRRLALSSSS